MKINKMTFEALHEVMNSMDYSIKDADENSEYYSKLLNTYIEENKESLNELSNYEDDYHYSNYKNNKDKYYLKSCMITKLRDYLFDNFQKIIKDVNAW